MSKIYLVAILIIFFLLLVGGIVYLSKQFTKFFNPYSSKLYYLLFSVLYLGMFVGLFMSVNSAQPWAHCTYIVSSYLVGLGLYLLLSSILLHIISLFTHLHPKLCGISVLFLTMAICLYASWNGQHVRSTEYTVEMPNLDKPVRIAQLSDIHLGHIKDTNFIHNIVKRVKNNNVDAVVITGDYLESKAVVKKEYFDPLKDLNVPAFLVEGNHDIYSGISEVSQLMRNANVTVLQNQISNFKGIQLIGLNYYTSPDRIGEVLDSLSISSEKPTILLHHSPIGIEDAAANKINLFLAGHTHGGQLFPFNLITKLIYKFDRGMHDYKNTTVIVSQGVGTFGPPMRVASKSEIVYINLKPKN